MDQPVRSLLLYSHTKSPIHSQPEIRARAAASRRNIPVAKGLNLAYLPATSSDRHKQYREFRGLPVMKDKVQRTNLCILPLAQRKRRRHPFDVSDKPMATRCFADR